MISQSSKLNPKIFSDEIESLPTRHGFGDAILSLGEEYSDVVVLTADLAESTRVLEFQKRYPDRFFQVGVAEQNMAGIAAGLASSGKVPFMTSYAIFSPGGNWLQIRTSICYSNENVKIVSTHAGYSAGFDGATHQALEDIALMRTLPNMVVLAPCDYEEAKKATFKAYEHKGPVYLRLTREKTPAFTTSETPFEIGKACVLTEGKDVTVIACGPVIYEVLKAANNLKDSRGISCEVINCASIKPLDEGTILQSVKKTKKAVTVEEHQIAGGLGGTVAEALSEKFPVTVKRIGSNDDFGETGSYWDILEKRKLTAKFLAERISNCL